MRRTQPQQSRSDLRRASRQRLCGRSGVGQQQLQLFDLKSPACASACRTACAANSGLRWPGRGASTALSKSRQKVPRDDLQAGGEALAKTQRRNVEASLQHGSHNANVLIEGPGSARPRPSRRTRAGGNVYPTAGCPRQRLRKPQA